MTAATSLVQRLDKPRSSMAELWAFLTEPSSDIRSAEIRRKARLLSAILFPTMILGLLASTLIPLIVFGAMFRTTADFITLGGALVLGVAYLISRTRYYLIAAYMVVAIITVGALVSSTLDPNYTERMLSYLSMGVLLGSMLLSVPATVALAVVNLVATWAVALLVPGMPQAAVISATVFQIMMYTLITIFSAIRFRDLQQIERQSAELARAVQEAQDANRLKSEFLATMSHELRTPLNAIIGFTEVMSMGLTGELPTRTRHTTERIHHNSERLLQLIDDILDISKIEAGRIEILHQPFEPAQLLSSVETSLVPLVKAKQITLALDLDPTLPKRVTGDFQRLEQITLNLGSNAVKFTETGTVGVILKRLNEREWGIIVTDTGIGIPPHARDIIFEKFRQVDGSTRRAYGGTGLGLAIVKELVLLMNGNIKVESEVGVGSKFTVTLPLDQAQGT